MTTLYIIYGSIAWVFWLLFSFLYALDRNQPEKASSYALAALLALLWPLLPIMVAVVGELRKHTSSEKA